MDRVSISPTAQNLNNKGRNDVSDLVILFGVIGAQYSVITVLIAAEYMSCIKYPTKQPEAQKLGELCYQAWYPRQIKAYFNALRRQFETKNMGEKSWICEIIQKNGNRLLYFKGYHFSGNFRPGLWNIFSENVIWWQIFFVTNWYSKYGLLIPLSQFLFKIWSAKLKHLFHYLKNFQEYNNKKDRGNEKYYFCRPLEGSQNF